MGFGDADVFFFFFYYKLHPGPHQEKKLRPAISLHVLQLCKDQEDLFLLAARPSPETEKPIKRKGLLGLCCGQVDRNWCQMSNVCHLSWVKNN